MPCEGEIGLHVAEDGAIDGDANCIDPNTGQGLDGPVSGSVSGHEVTATWAVQFGPEAVELTWTGTIGGGAMTLAIEEDFGGMGSFVAAAELTR